MAYSCRKCSPETRRSAVGLAVTVVVVVLVTVGMLLRQLGRAEEDRTGEGRDNVRHGIVERKCADFHGSVMKVLPLTAIKIVGLCGKLSPRCVERRH